MNVLIAAVLSPKGSPAALLRAWLEGRFELIISASLIEELERALDYPRVRKRISGSQAAELVALLEKEAVHTEDAQPQTAVRSPDPGDDYLIGLAESTNSLLVSGDSHLLELGSDLPVLTPRQMLNRVD